MPPRPSIPADDLYARLEVAPDASSETIEIAWRALLKRHHPDIAGHEALELAKRINVAHDWLSDPALRERYDRERTGRSPRADRFRPRGGAPAEPDRPGRPAQRPSGAPPVRRAPPNPAEALRRFLERVGRLSPNELDRLSVAETTSIAFVASIDRFLDRERREALTTIEQEVRRRLPPAAWATAPIRDAVLAAAHELVLATFLDEHLTEPFRGRARDRLMRGWEAAVDQPRYGPNTPVVERFLERVAALEEAEARALARAAPRPAAPPLRWPRDLDPDEHDGLRVSSALAQRDAILAATAALAGVEPNTAASAERALAQVAHALVLRHAFTRPEFDALVAPWTAVTGDPGTGRAADTTPEPRVRRR